mmetsp:Transcript_62190/g.202929  ORF Transcript_62190/g.202929 Transcript_62190/m.202929 type:complete len:216 (+) Transcript_62190:341-988(+)
MPVPLGTGAGTSGRGRGRAACARLHFSDKSSATVGPDVAVQSSGGAPVLYVAASDTRSVSLVPPSEENVWLSVVLELRAVVSEPSLGVEAMLRTERLRPVKPSPCLNRWSMMNFSNDRRFCGWYSTLHATQSLGSRSLNEASFTTAARAPRACNDAFCSRRKPDLALRAAFCEAMALALFSAARRGGEEWTIGLSERESHSHTPANTSNRGLEPS